MCWVLGVGCWVCLFTIGCVYSIPTSNVVELAMMSDGVSSESVISTCNGMIICNLRSLVCSQV